MKTTFTIKGTHCNACKMLIEDVSKDTDGIQSCSIDYKTGATEVEHDGSVDWDAFKKEIENLGKYKVEINSQKTP